jgi:hypothetical protein
MTVLLRKFNNGGTANEFPPGLVECSPNKTSDLRKISRDPTTEFNCPGLNESCAAAEVVVFPATSNPFIRPKFTRSVNMPIYSTESAYWQMSPPVAAANRNFTVSSKGSNFTPTLSVLSGTCNLVTSNGATVVDSSGLATNVTGMTSNSVSQLKFTTDGTSTYYIVASPGLGIPGKLKITITSP